MAAELNMLLSFAQFEREIAGERIRDKTAASKRKGGRFAPFLPFNDHAGDQAARPPPPEQRKSELTPEVREGDAASGEGRPPSDVKRSPSSIGSFGAMISPPSVRIGQHDVCFSLGETMSTI